jgi:starch synthase (maltosyl-transferring)
MVLVYEKATPDRSNVLLIAVSFDPFGVQESGFDLPLWRWQLPDDAALEVQDLLSDARFAWRGRFQTVRLTPASPYGVWRLRPTEPNG